LADDGIGGGIGGSLGGIGAGIGSQGIGGGANWVPTANGVPATLAANFTTGQYWFGAPYGDLPTWLSALSGSFSRPSTATYVNSAGVLATAASGVARFDYNPVTRVPRGLFLEQGSTNLALQSNAFTTTWTAAANASLSSAAGTSPDGTNDAWNLFENSTTAAVHTNTQAFVKAASANAYSFAVYAKAGLRTRIELQLNDNAANGAFSVFDLSGGQIGVAATGLGTPFTSLSASITNAGNGWYRCTLIATSNTATALNALIGLDNGSGTGARSNSYAGTINSGALIFGAQLEQAAFASSYISTTTLTVSRAADVCDLGNHISAAAWTIASQIYQPLANVWYINANGAFAPIIAQTTISVAYNGSVNLIAPSYLNNPTKIATAADGTGRSITGDGQTVQSDANTYAIITDIALMTPFGGGQPICTLAMWNAVKASSAELQRLST
jgi:hypothetical protein